MPHISILELFKKFQNGKLTTILKSIFPRLCFDNIPQPTQYEGDFWG